MQNDQMRDSCGFSTSNPIWTDYKEHEGYFGTGEVPIDISAKLPELRDFFYNEIPEDKKNDSTYHIWFRNSNPKIKNIIEEIQKHPFWKGLCGCKKGCVMKNLSEMDELYYSRAPRDNKSSGMLYGASSNYGLHVDGIFHFPGIRFYRVLIGLTPNDTVETRFPNLERSVYIRTNKYVIFDFDRAQHEVINHNREKSDISEKEDPYRIMLKLHFCVCDGCEENSAYFQWVSQCYLWFEKITRYIMQTGTNPQTPYQYFIGFSCQLWIFHRWLVYLFMLMTIVYLLLRNYLDVTTRAVLGWIILCMLGLFLATIVLLWFFSR